MCGRCCKDNKKSLTHIKHVYPPQGFLRGHQPSILLLDIIDVTFIVLLVSLSHRHGHTGMTLLNVVKLVLYNLDAPTCLNIDVAIEHG